MKTRRTLGFSSFLFSVLVIFYTAAPAQSKTVELTFASAFPSTSSTGIVASKWLDALEKTTNGQVKFKRLWSGTLLKGKAMYEGVSGGVADMGLSVFGYNPGRFQLWEGMALPVGFNSAAVANKVQWELYKKFRPKELANTKVLLLFTCSPCHIWSKVPIRKMEDMSGVEIRATGFAAKIVNILGGVPVGAPMPAVYEMLSKGIVDGCWSSLDTLMSYKHSDVTKFVTLNGLYVSSFYVVMNWNSWNRLPADIQKNLEGYTEEYLSIAAETWDQRHNKALQFAREKGLEIISLPPEELARWKKKSEPLIDTYIENTKANGLPGKEFLVELERLKDKYGK